jgi:hypothetical protein
MRGLIVSVVGVAGWAACASGANVLVLSSLQDVTDEAVVGRLQGLGHTVTLGPAAHEFDGSTDLSPYDAVLLQLSYNWGYGDMPEGGQSALVAFVNGGGGLVTGEWLSYEVYYGSFQTIEPLLPFAATGVYDDIATDTYTVATAEPLINLGLPDSFEFPLVDYDGGTEGELIAKNGVAVFYTSGNLAGGLIGWAQGEGRVLSFSGTLGPDQVNDEEFGVLLSNALEWAAGGSRCYADFTGDGTLDLFDFLAYVNSFNANAGKADCTEDGSLDLFDFLCFVNAFNMGC